MINFGLMKFEFNHIECLEHKLGWVNFEELQIFTYYETFKHSLVGAPILSNLLMPTLLRNSEICM